MFSQLPVSVSMGSNFGPEETGGGGGASAGDIAAAVVAALNATTIPVDAQKMNGADIIGTGTTGDAWRGVGVSP